MKYLTSTYLKDIEKYRISIFIERNFCLVIKKIIDMNNPFILNEEGNYITILDKNYYIIEYMPFNENYICRIHMDNNKNIIEKFF